MGILGIAGLIVVLSAYYGGPIQVATGWYYFWWVMLVLDFLNSANDKRSK